MADGTWHDAAIENYPSVVLGSAATRRLGIAAVGIGEQWFTVVGIRARR